MEFAIGAVVCLVILGIIGALFGDDKTARPGGAPGEFSVRVREMTEKNEETGHVYPAFAIQARGYIPVPHDQCPVEFRLHIFDGPDDDLKPVLCTLEELQEKETLAFESRSDTIPMPFENGLAEWTTMFSIPKEILVFPARGDRRVVFQFTVIAPSNPPVFQYGFTDGSTGMAYTLGYAVQSFENPEEGYEEGEDNRRAALHTTVELALHLAAVDGQLGKPEAQVVRDWMKNTVTNIPEEIRKEETEKLRKLAGAAYQCAVKGETELNDIVRKLNGAASTQEKYDALELCMDVMAADGKANPKEIQELDQIAKMLRVDPNTYRSLREQRLAKVSDVAQVSGNLDTMLGITSDMSPEAVKQHLTAEYRKWNSRVSHSDEKIRKRASEMLLLIGEARAKYVD
jgi:uncharacterized tellurite resistance protein B-like protein